VIELPEDFRDLLLDLADNGADFVLVGGHAVAFHGHPRATKDMDVLIRANSTNAERVYKALGAFGAPLQNFDVQAKDFATYDGMLQSGCRTDGLTSSTVPTESASMRPLPKEALLPSRDGEFPSSGAPRSSRTSAPQGVRRMLQTWRR